MAPANASRNSLRDVRVIVCSEIQSESCRPATQHWQRVRIDPQELNEVRRAREEGAVADEVHFRIETVVLGAQNTEVVPFHGERSPVDAHRLAECAGEVKGDRYVAQLDEIGGLDPWLRNGCVSVIRRVD